ncbi:MAG: hypothetical protein WB714_16735 [Candidatus Sulfotelmatobacter sp.]
MTRNKHWHWLMPFPPYRESKVDHAIVPDCVFGDRGYDTKAIRQALRSRHILPFLAKRNTEHAASWVDGDGVVERTFAWLNQFRRRRVRYEKRPISTRHICPWDAL